jgi:hypothetical protein
LFSFAAVAFQNEIIEPQIKFYNSWMIKLTIQCFQTRSKECIFQKKYHNRQVGTAADTTKRTFQTIQGVAPAHEFQHNPQA